MEMVAILLFSLAIVLWVGFFDCVGAQDPPNLLTQISNFTLTSNVPLIVTAKPSPDYTIFPNGVTIQPIGKTTVVFTICALVQNCVVTSVPVTLMVPVTTYLGFPVTGAASKTINLTPGQDVVVSGVGGPVTRLFYGVSWQSFPQLRGVSIANKSWIWTWPPVPPNVTRVEPYQIPMWTKFDSFSIPPLMCMLSIHACFSSVLVLAIQFPV